VLRHLNLSTCSTKGCNPSSICDAKHARKWPDIRRDLARLRDLLASWRRKVARAAYGDLDIPWALSDEYRYAAADGILGAIREGINKVGLGTSCKNNMGKEPRQTMRH
jgi:hypothetical protein